MQGSISLTNKICMSGNVRRLPVDHGTAGADQIPDPVSSFYGKVFRYDMIQVPTRPFQFLIPGWNYLKRCMPAYL